MAMAHEFYTVFLHKIPVLATQKVPSNLQIHKYTGQRINIHGTYRQFNQLLTRDVSILRTYLGIGPGWQLELARPMFVLNPGGFREFRGFGNPFSLL
jgi:hypothetical protein